MTTIVLEPDLLAELERRADREGEGVSAVINNLLRHALGAASATDTPKSRQESLSPEEWTRQMHEAFGRLPHTAGKPLSDEAMSRETIYD